MYIESATTDFYLISCHQQHEHSDRAILWSVSNIGATKLIIYIEDIEGKYVL